MPETFTVRAATVEDVREAQIISALTGNIDQTIKRSPDEMLMVFSHGLSALVFAGTALASHAGVTLDHGDDGIEIGAVVTVPVFRRQGAADHAVRHVLSIIAKNEKYRGRKVTAFVNEESRQLFAKLGGSPVDGTLSEELRRECSRCRHCSLPVDNPEFRCCSRLMDMTQAVQVISPMNYNNLTL